MMTTVMAMMMTYDDDYDDDDYDVDDYDITDILLYWSKNLRHSKIIKNNIYFTCVHARDEES